MSTEMGDEEPSWLGVSGWDGTDGELFLRADSAMDLGTGLHELAALAERHVADLDQLSAVDAAARSRSAQMLPAELRDMASETFVSLTQGFQQQLQQKLDTLDPSTLTAVSDPFEWMLSQLSGSFRQGIQTAQSALHGLPARDPQLFRYLMQLGLASERRPRLSSIRRALLITTVASAESGIRGVLHRLVFHRDGGSWDLLAHDETVSKLMKGGIENWQQNLREQGFDLDLASATSDWPSVREIWARRHVLVHNAGIADDRYLQRVPGATRGAMLEVDDGYLRNAIDLLCGFILGVIIAAWDKISAGNRTYILHLALAYAAVADGEQRWPLAETLNLLAVRLDDDPVEATVHRVNSWLARVRWRGPQSVHTAVCEWDTAGLPPRFGVAKDILLGNIHEALATLPALVAQGEISPHDLKTWPLFDSIRNEPTFLLLSQS
jgi:hypothetical protein